MATWAVAKATEDLLAVLDKAEAEGPQLIERGAKRFVVVAEEAFNGAAPAAVVAPATPRPLGSAWELLRPPQELLVDHEFERLDWKQREIGL